MKKNVSKLLMMLFFLIPLPLMAGGCGGGSSSSAVTPEPPENRTIRIRINDRNFSAKLYDNETSRALLARLPMTLDMSDLHSNEKYYYLPYSLPTNSQRVGNINAGDLMLYGSDCLVLFYKSFSTSYSYTKLGYIEDVSGLAAALGSGSVLVTFEEI
jgi:hypothetical protein